MPIRVPDSAAFLAELVRARSDNPPGREAGVGRLFAERLSDLGLAVSLHPVAPERLNVLGRLAGSGERPALLLSGHLDTVPVTSAAWDYPPYEARVVKGRMVGRGTSDMKAGLVALALAAGRVARSGAPLKGDLLLLATADEEAGCLGAEAFVAEGGARAVGGVLVAEPTDLALYLAQKGVLALRATITGRAAHGAFPHLGVNAIEVAADFVAALRRLDLPHRPHAELGGPTVNVGTIAGGTRSNIVPDRCEITLDVRTVPGQEPASVRGAVERVLAEVCEGAGAGYTLDVLHDGAPLETDREAPLARALAEAILATAGEPARFGAALYFTEGAILGPALGAPVVICGPGEPTVAHQANEWVLLRRVEQAIDLYEHVIRALLT